MGQPMITTPTPWSDWVVILPVVLPLLAAAVLLALRGMRALQAPVAGLVTFAVLLCGLELLTRTSDTGPVSMTMGKWLPPFGISFTADVMSAIFVLVSALVTLVVIAYLQMERSESDGRSGLYPLVLLLLAGVCGSFLTGDLFNLYVWFEVMLIASFGLFVLGGRNIQLDATLKYGFLNFLATTIFLASLGVIYGTLGTLNMADITLVAPDADPAVMTTIAALLLLAFGMKAAAFPLNQWLPASYHAPSAALSALMAGLLTKVGVYALLRSLVVLMPAGRDLLEPVIATVAILTLVVAPLGAIAETNLRRAIGFLVIGGIGSVMVGLALPDMHGLAGSTLYIVHSMLTMTALYCVAGLVEKLTGRTDTREMGGLYAASSPVSILFILLVFSAAGLPPFLGFWPKLLLLEAGISGAEIANWQIDWLAMAMIGALLVNAWLTLIAGTRLWAHVFWRNGPAGAPDGAAGPVAHPLTAAQQRFGTGASIVLVGLILAAGLWPNLLIETARLAAVEMIDPQRYIAAFGLGTIAP
ncbi:multicomponent Na+:H+ antiporter subunit D [Devosia enhydra]|uniref:Multicomponent Na+:H+ antiporter subunit D n=2 Tax=Devosia enhydra TaxID=665118 RepID=A0A1K2I0R2_9HYPH|nr:multicomponent Na+:H+ antiporter subunit D [Devosia enhydra]